MKIYLEQSRKIIEKKFEGKVNVLLKNLKIASDTVLIVCNGELITEEDTLKDTDEVKILSVVSGG